MSIDASFKVDSFAFRPTTLFQRLFDVLVLSSPLASWINPCRWHLADLPRSLRLISPGGGAPKPENVPRYVGKSIGTTRAASSSVAAFGIVEGDDQTFIIWRDPNYRRLPDRIHSINLRTFLLSHRPIRGPVSVTKVMLSTTN